MDSVAKEGDMTALEKISTKDQCIETKLNYLGWNGQNVEDIENWLGSTWKCRLTHQGTVRIRERKHRRRYPVHSGDFLVKHWMTSTVEVVESKDFHYRFQCVEVPL